MALGSVLADVNFVEAEIKRLGKSELDHVFDEVKLVSCVAPLITQAEKWSSDYQYRALRCGLGIYGNLDPPDVIRRSQADPTRSHPREVG